MLLDRRRAGRLRRLGGRSTVTESSLDVDRAGGRGHRRAVPPAGRPGLAARAQPRRRVRRLRHRAPATCAASSACWRASGPASRATWRSTRSTSGPSPAPWWWCSARCCPRRWRRATVRLVRRGLPVIVVDTLPEDAAPSVSTDDRPGDRGAGLADAAASSGATSWRSLAAAGCPVVPWRGPRHPRGGAAPAGAPGPAAPGRVPR